MLEIVKVSVIFSMILCVKCQSSYGDEDYLYGVGNNYYYEDVFHTEQQPLIEDYNKLVEKLYGETASPGWPEANDDGNEIFCGFGRLWKLEQLKNTIKVEADGVLSEKESEFLLSAVENDVQRELNNSRDTGKRCPLFYNQLQTNRHHLDCALGSKVVTSLFSQMKPGESGCWPYTEKVWRRIVSAGDLAAKGCSAPEVYDDLIVVAQITLGRYKANFSSESYMAPFHLMAETTEIISRPERLEYLSRISCGPNIPASRCPTIMSLVALTACVVIDVATISDIENVMKKGVTAPSDVRIMLELMDDLTKIVGELSEDKVQAPHRDARLAVNAIDNYLDVMDNAIGESAHAVWSELPEDETKKQLQLVLVNNDEYIGAMSKIMFDSKRIEMAHANLDKGAIAIGLKRFETKNESELVGFEFNDTRIETTLPGYDMTNKYNVYAIHYKSWAELLQKEGLKVNDTSNGNKTKFFVGEGGIVSLTARTEDGQKSSLPVKYKMNFKNVMVDEDLSGGVARRRCMSCEFFNTETGDWEDTGCSVSHIANDAITCTCNHTTNFAAFMSPVPVEFEMTEEQYQAKQIVSYIGSTVSVLSLAISLIIFNIVRPTVKNDRMKAHINLALALFMVHMTQLITDFVIDIDVACLVVAMVTHFFLLASFFWMLIEGIFLYLYVVQVFVHSTIEYLQWLYVAGWVLPALIVAISAGVGIPRDTYLDVYPDYCEEMEVLYPPLIHGKYEQCWLSVKSGMAWSFIGPTLIIILFNSVILCKVFQVLKKVSSRSSNIRPFQPSTSSSKKDTSSGYFNKTFVRKEFESQDQQKTSELKVQKCKNLPESTREYGSTSLSNGQSGMNPNDSPSRFDARVPSQAYMHNRAHPTKTSPEKSNLNGKYFLSDVRAALKGAMVLLPILGIPWIFGLWAASSYFAMMFFLVINSTQGFAIFVVYCLMNGEVKRAMQRRIKTAKLRSQTGRSRTSSTSSLRSLNSRFGRNWRSSSSEAPQK